MPYPHVERHSQTHALREAEVRLLAYLKWEEAGKPEGRSEEFWLSAEEYLEETK